MCQCHAYASCRSCSRFIDRRRFLHHSGVALAVAGSLSPIVSADERRKIRVAAVFLVQVRNSWPYPGFDAVGRQREVLAALRQGCPQIEFVPVTIKTPGEAGKALALREQVDGYLVYVTTLSWALRGVLAAIGKLNTPTVVADEFLGGSGAYPTWISAKRPSGPRAGRTGQRPSHWRASAAPQRRGRRHIHNSAGRPSGGGPPV